jgi:hypothetical protein
MSHSLPRDIVSAKEGPQGPLGLFLRFLQRAGCSSTATSSSGSATSLLPGFLTAPAFTEPRRINGQVVVKRRELKCLARDPAALRDKVFGQCLLPVDVSMNNVTQFLKTSPFQESVSTHRWARTHPVRRSPRSIRRLRSSRRCFRVSDVDRRSRVP